MVADVALTEASILMRAVVRERRHIELRLLALGDGWADGWMDGCARRIWAWGHSPKVTKILL